MYEPEVGGGKRGGGMSWETEIGIYTLPCVRQIANEKLLHNSGSPLGALRGRNGVEYGGEGGRLMRERICVYL